MRAINWEYYLTKLVIQIQFGKLLLNAYVPSRFILQDTSCSVLSEAWCVSTGRYNNRLFQSEITSFTESYQVYSILNSLLQDKLLTLAHKCMHSHYAFQTSFKELQRFASRVCFRSLTLLELELCHKYQLSLLVYVNRLLCIL